ncbi:MAG: hypothetical protein JWP57_4466 [Spirosoma sp.]|nr:hypothetical protein [Spirosoma sp.]
MNTTDNPHLDTHAVGSQEGGSNAVESTVIPVIEEQLQVEKQVIETGRLLINKTVREEEQVVTTPLMHDEISVERVPINKYVETIPVVRYENELTIVPVVKEVLVLEKRLMLVEEVHITKRRLSTDDTQRVMLRREEVTVERVPPNETDVRSETRPSL